MFVPSGAWIITGGTASGVMEFVGEAVADYVTVSGKSSGECVALGIAPWGATANRMVLDGEDVSTFLLHLLNILLF